MSRVLWPLSGKSPLRLELAKAAAGTLALNILSKVLALVASILLARYLGAREFGIYVSAIAAVLLLVAIAQLGFPTLVIRLLSTYEAHREWSLMHGLMRFSNLLLTLISLVLAGAGAVIVCSLEEDQQAIRAPALWAMALLPIAVLTSLHAGMLRGLRHIISAQLPESLIAPAVFVSLVAAWQLFEINAYLDLTSEVAIALRLAAAAFALCVGVCLLAIKVPREVLSSVPQYDKGLWLTSAVPLLFLGGMTIINTQADVLMLSALQGAESAGIYQAAARGGELVAFSLFIISGVIQPTIARLYALGERHHLQRLLTASSRAAMVLALPIALVLALFAKPLLGNIYGPEFERGAVALAILCGAQMVNVSVGLVGQILIMTGHEGDAAIGVGIGAGVNVLLNLILIPVWGLAGAACATGISLIVWNVFLAARVWSRTRLSSGFLRTGWSA